MDYTQGKLIMTKGLPGSGKSTWAREMVRTKPNFKRINKDDLRAMIDDSIWSKNNEFHIVKARNLLVKLYMEQLYNIIVDDTNMEPVHEEVLKQIAADNNYKFEVNDSFLDVPVSVCIERDALRAKPVGADIIKRMAKKYIQYRTPKIDSVKREENPFAIVCDLDGTIAHHVARSPYDFDKCDTDEPINYVIKTVQALAAINGYKIIFLSGREDSCYNKTYSWLKEKANFSHLDFSLIMRRTGDRRPDNIVKGELMTTLMGTYSIFAVFDDRESVVKEWNKMGLPVFDCSNGRGKF